MAKRSAAMYGAGILPVDDANHEAHEGTTAWLRQTAPPGRGFDSAFRIHSQF